MRVAETGLYYELMKIWRFAESDRECGLIWGEDVETFPKDPFKTAEAWKVGCDYVKVMGGHEKGGKWSSGDGGH